ncbi:hypothetical protein Tco_0765452 [Tanacetum coccineum]
MNSAAGGNLLERHTQDVLTIIKNKSKVHNSRNKLIVSQVKSSDVNSFSSSEIDKITHAVNQQTSDVTTAMTAILKQFQATPPPVSVKAVEEICVTCGGAHHYYQCLAADGNTFSEFQDNIQGYISVAVVNYNQELQEMSLFRLESSHSLLILSSLIMKAILVSPSSWEDLSSESIRRALIDVAGEERIDLRDIYLEDLFANEKITNHLSGNPTPISDPIVSSSPTLTSLEESDLIWEEFEAYLAQRDFLFPPGSYRFYLLLTICVDGSRDELALITFPPGNDDLPLIIESDLREIEYLLNHDPTKEMDSILEDSVDEGNLADPNNDLSDNDDVYDDPFDSKEDKIKESKLLIDELDPPRSSDFLPSPECDSVLYEDFSEVDALPSTNNEDKVFNPGILIHENLFEVTIRATPDKNVKKISISNASLILEDFNPPLYELPFDKEVPTSTNATRRFHSIAMDFDASRARGKSKDVGNEGRVVQILGLCGVSESLALSRKRLRDSWGQAKSNGYDDLETSLTQETHPQLSLSEEA